MLPRRGVAFTFGDALPGDLLELLVVYGRAVEQEREFLVEPFFGLLGGLLHLRHEVVAVLVVDIVDVDFLLRALHVLLTRLLLLVLLSEEPQELHRKSSPAGGSTGEEERGEGEFCSVLLPG